MSDNNVNDVYESGDGKLYVALNNGKINIIENDIIKDTLAQNIVINRFFVTPDHKVFAVTDLKGICEFKDGILKILKQQYSYVSYEKMISFNDSLFAVSSPEIPVRILNSHFESVAETKETASILYCLFKDSRNRFWVGTESGLMVASVLWNKKRELKFTSPASALNIPEIGKIFPSDIIEEKSGTLWIGTNKNVLKIKPNGIWQAYSEKDGLPSNNISCIFQDKEKNIWIGTAMGLTKITTKNDIQIYTQEVGLPDNNVIHVLTETNSNIFAVTGGPGKYKIREINETSNNLSVPGKDQVLYKYNELPPPFFISVHNIDSFRTIDLPDIERVKIGVHDPFCAVARWGNYYIGSEGGLLIHSSNKTILNRLMPYRIQNLLFDRKGFLWVGTWENGLFRLKLNETHDDIMSVENLTSLITEGSVRSIFEDKSGNIWIGTRNQGATQISEQNDKWHRTHYDQHTGLISNFIRVINEDRNGNIWLGSYLGLDKLIRTDTGFRIFNFSRINNFFCIVNDIAFTQDNLLWCGTSAGLVKITDEKTDEIPPLPVYLTSISLAGKRIDFPSTKKIVLHYDQNEANFVFTSPSYINEKQIQYSYRLKGGLDTTWSIPSNIHTVSYASLQPGNYIFEVRTIGWNGGYGDTSSFNFIINPPFWQKWWFIALLALGVIIILIALYQYRVNELLKIQKVRNRLATDLHDDIGSTLTNISILSELSKKNIQQPRQAGLFLQRITEEVTASGQALDDIIWSVNSRNDTIEETLTRMRRYAAELFDPGNILYHLQLDESVKGKKLEMEQRRDIYLIYKESLNNIFKHAHAKSVWVKAGINHQTFELMIKDDGKGFKTDQPTFRNGLKNLRWRVEKWKGDFQIQSIPGEGTIITIKMPVGK